MDSASWRFAVDMLTESSLKESGNTGKQSVGLIELMSNEHGNSSSE